MRSANTTEFSHYTREELAQIMGVSVCTLRSLARDLRQALSPEEFGFLPNDGLIKAQDARKLLEYRARAREATRARVFEQIKVKGL